MNTYYINYSKTRNGSKLYTEVVEAETKAQAIDFFYQSFPKFHIRGKIEEVISTNN